MSSLRIQKLLGAALLLPIVLTSACKKDDATATAPPPLPVKLQTIQSGQVEDSSVFVGNLEAKQKVALAPQIAGRIEQILVAQGEAVSKGTPILQLRPEKQEAQVAGSVATVSAATATLQNAQAEARAADSEVARLEAQIKAQEADVQSRTAALDLARTNFERSESLVAEGAAAQQDLDDKTNALRNATAARDAALQTLEANRRAYNTAIARAQGSNASIDAARANLQNAEAQVRSAGVDLSYNQVVAPLDGIVGDLLFKVGDFVNVGQQVTSIIQNDELDLRISAPTKRTGQLRQGLPVQLLDPNNQQSLASGSITFISPQVDSAAQSILTKARFPNRTGKLRDGQYVQARVVWNRSAGVTVPTTAISRIGGQSFVFVANEGPCDPNKTAPNAAPQTDPKLVVCQKPVQLGDVQGSDYKVLQGLKPGDRIAVSNILKLRDGAPIQPEA